MQPGHRSSLATLLAAGAFALAGCGDAVTDPDALLTADEAENVRRSAAALPSLPSILAEAWGSDGGVEAAVARDLWAQAATEERAWRAQGLRLRAVALVAPRLEADVDARRRAELRAALRDWSGTVAELVLHLDLPDLQARLRLAERHLGESEALEAAGDGGGALRELLLAAGRLEDTTPRTVARRLTRDAAAALARSRGLESATKARAERLVQHAMDALHEGDDLRALQRAYYALQLLEAM